MKTKDSSDEKIVLYITKDKEIALKVSLTNDTVWLSIEQMTKLFGRDKSVISRHLTNIFKTKELDKNRTVAKFATVQKEGKREIKRDMLTWKKKQRIYFTSLSRTIRL